MMPRVTTSLEYIHVRSEILVFNIQMAPDLSHELRPLIEDQTKREAYGITLI